MEIILLFFSKLFFYTITSIFLAIGCMCFLIFFPGLFLDNKTRGDLFVPLLYFSYFVGIYIFIGLWVDDIFGVYIYPDKYIGLIFENTLANVLICILSVTYPWIHNLLRYLGEKIFNKTSYFLSYIKTINIFYMLIFIFVVSLFGFTDFSLKSGWDFVTSGEDDLNWTGGRGPLFAILFIIYPTVILLSAIFSGFTSYNRIKDPGNILNEDYD
jgi:hypothetical protein